MKKNSTLLKNNRIITFIKIFFVIILMLILAVDIYAERDFEKEEKIGRRMAERAEKQYELVDDPENLAKVQRIGEHLKSISDFEQINYQFNIIDRKGPNAFAFPGGFIYFTADLFDYVQSDDELAAIIAHEMGHIIHQHSIKQMQDNQKLQIVELLTILLTGDPTLGLLSELTSITLLNAYRREYEEEADLTALEMLNISPYYHPVALLTYFERVGNEYLLKPDRKLGIFQTHPDINERINKVKQYLRQNGIEINRRLTTNYLLVDGKLQEQEGIIVAQIYIDEEEIFSFTGSEEEFLYQKMTEVVSNFDQSLRLDLEPYEIVLYSDEKQCTLRIGSDVIVSLSPEEVNYQNLTVTEVLEQAKKKMSRILWQLKLKLPTLLFQG